MSNDQNRDQPGDRNRKTGREKQHDDEQGGGGGASGGGGQTKHAEGSKSEPSGPRTGTRAQDSRRA